MKVKVGDQWYEPQPGQPIMVVLEKQDRLNIEDMPPGASKYACFHDDDENTKDQMQEWMNGGS